MMNPALSHRLAQIAETLIRNGMTFEEKYELSQLIDKVDKFEDLPDNFKQSILAAEKETEPESKASE